jgi:hypothetical protein
MFSGSVFSEAELRLDLADLYNRAGCLDLT